MTNLLYFGIPAVVVVIIALRIILKHRPRKLNAQRFGKRWSELQKNCADRKTWHKAIVEADTLLDEALKRCRYKGKSTGERLVSAQHTFTSNDTVWFGHKLRNRIIQEDLKKISKQDTLEALSGFRQALKDLGALRNDQPTTES